MAVFNSTSSTVLLMALLALGSPQAGAADATVKIGLLPPMTGLEKEEGPIMVNSAMLAIKQINANGGVNGKKLELVTEDNQSTPTGALAAYTKLIDEKKVAAVIATAKSAQGVALGPKADTSQIPTIIGGTNPRLTENHPYFFRCRPDDFISSYAIVRYVLETTKFKKIAVINDAGPFGTGGANLIDKNAKEQGLKLVARETFKPGERNLAPYMERIKAAGAEVLVSYSANYSDQGAVEEQLVKMHQPFMFIGSPSAFTKIAIEMSKGAEGIYAALDVVMGQTEANRRYVEAYKKEYGADPDPQSSYAYDGVNILANAMKAAGSTDSKKVRTAILGVRGYEGVLGTYNFSQNGDGLHQVSIGKWENGKPKLEKIISH